MTNPNGATLTVQRHIAVTLFVLGVATSAVLTARGMNNGEEKAQSGLLRLLIPARIQESAPGATIIFQAGLKGTLSRNQEDYESHLSLAQQGLERRHPVGVRVDSAGEIGQIARADNDFIAFIGEETGNTVKVGFQGHDGTAYLDRRHARYDEIIRDLERSLKEKRRIWFVWSHPRLMLEDALIVDE